MFPANFGIRESDENWKQRRKEIVTCLGINKSLQYIWMIIDIIDEKLQEYSTKNEVDFTEMLTKSIFLVITKIFFGHDIIEKLVIQSILILTQGQRHT